MHRLIWGSFFCQLHSAICRVFLSCLDFFKASYYKSEKLVNLPIYSFRMKLEWNWFELVFTSNLSCFFSLSLVLYALYLFARLKIRFNPIQYDPKSHGSEMDPYSNVTWTQSGPDYATALYDPIHMTCLPPLVGILNLDWR